MSAAEKRIEPYEVICDVSGRDAWLAERAQGIGASEIAAVLGESPWQSPVELYAEKIGSYSRDLSDSEPVFWGLRLEASIIEAYAERTRRHTRKAGLLLRSIEHPWALCTLDGETWTDGAEPWPFEVKNVSSFKGDEWVDGPPEHYRLQVMQQMLVTGAQKATIAALLGGQRMVWCDVHRDDITIRRIIHHGSRFWERVQRRDMPNPDGSEGTRKALQALYPDGKGTVALPATALDAADELELVREKLRDLEARKGTIENTVRAALGDAEMGILPDGRHFSWKLQHRKAATIAASSFRVLRLHKSRT